MRGSGLTDSGAIGAWIKNVEPREQAQQGQQGKEAASSGVEDRMADLEL